jgi:predicted phosphoribosyltransferase
MRFHDRQKAGHQLAALLHGYREKDPIVLALPRGGVPVGYEVARALAARSSCSGTHCCTSARATSGTCAR